MTVKEQAEANALDLLAALKGLEPFFREWVARFPANGGYCFHGGSPQEVWLTREHAATVLRAIDLVEGRA